MKCKMFRTESILCSVPQNGCLLLLSLFFLVCASNLSTQAELILRDVAVSLNALNLEEYNLDVDLNGTTDFTFNASLVPDPTIPVGFNVINFPFASNNGVVIDSVTGDGFPSASYLSLGNLVSDAQLYSFASLDQGNLFFAVGSEPPSGNFLNRSGFIGLRFDRPEGISFGFAEITVNDINAAVNPLGLSIGTVGFNNIAGAPALISSVPEPTSGLLVLVLTLVGFAFRPPRRAGV